MAQRAPFPSNPDVFDQDPRISYSKQTKTFLLEDEQGEEWEWLSGPAKWSKSMDEQLMQQQAEIYKVAGVDDDEPAVNPVQKRKAAQMEEANTNQKNAKAKTAVTPRENTAVYVTGLPLDVDVDEVRNVFGKYGVIAESVDNDDKRIKLYNDKDGNFKGEALIIYHRPESVAQATMLADDMDFPREYGVPTSRITVIAADRDFKAHKDDTVAEDRPKPKAKGKSFADKAKGKKKAEEMNRRLADWSDDEPSTMQQTSSRWDKVVVVKNFFTLEEIKDPEYLKDVTEDMTEDAATYGTVKNITFFDQEEDGVVTIRFSDAMAAKACANALDGRAYDGRRLEASIATGDEKFKKTRKVRNDDEDEAKRIENFSNFIEGREDAANGDARS